MQKITSEVVPTKVVEEFYQEERSTPNSLRRPTDTKIQSLVSLIPKESPSTLLASATSPRVVIDLIHEIPFQGTFEREFPKRPKRALRRPRIVQQVPIGLIRCELFPPLNAILQLALFLPTFRDVFTFAPRSYLAISDFIDEYGADQESGLPISSADPNRLCRLLIQKMEPQLFRFQSVKIDFLYFMQALLQSVLGRSKVLPNAIIWDVEFPFSCAIDIPSRPGELFVTVRNRTPKESCHMIQRQFFTKPDSCCYDLDAFLEYRPDGGENLGDHIAYLKVDGVWYQCDDDRIIRIRSTNLNPALYRSILLHYKRIWPK